MNPGCYRDLVNMRNFPHHTYSCRTPGQISALTVAMFDLMGAGLPFSDAYREALGQTGLGYHDSAYVAFCGLDSRASSGGTGETELLSFIGAVLSNPDMWQTYFYNDGFI